MDRESRSELLKTIEAQKEKIHKYETKLRDLIVAYKGVVKEKEALEASVKALVASETIPDAATRKDIVKSDTEGQEPTEPKDDIPAAQHDSEMRHLREQLTTLTASLATLTQEKSKLEASFLADKKLIRQELEDASRELKEERERHDKIVEQLTHDLREWKNKLRSQQHEREREHNDHALMLKELQKLLGDERAAKEALEHQVDELREEADARSHDSSAEVEQCKKKIEELCDQLNKTKKQLKAVEENANQPSPEYLELQKELLDLKTQHQFLLQKEQVYFSETEVMLDKRNRDSEQRISSLEAKISELSEMIGNYERLRTQDQNTIAKLKERISQLSMENSALAEAANKPSSMEQELSNVDNSIDVQTILDKILRLKELLKTANEQSDKPVNIEELLQHGLAITDHSSLHKKCIENYEQLKEDFERYKLRAQSVLKSRTPKEPSPCAEVEALHSEIAALRDCLFQLRTDHEEQSKLLRTKEDTFRLSITTLQERHTQELADLEQEYKQRMSELDAEIRRHRERTVTLLAEKDRELESLKMRLPEHLESQYYSTYRAFTQSSDPGEIGASSEEEGAVSELLTRTSLHGMSSDSAILHFAQEQARKEVEIQTLRKQKHDTELALRELQQSSTFKQQQFTEQIDLLKEEIRRYERNISRESANLEYLKNVVYHFMVCTDHVGKQTTLNAISTILQFSPQEKDRVQKELHRTWWTYINSQKKTKI